MRVAVDTCIAFYSASALCFRSVPKLVTLNDFERRNDHILRYFAEFGSFRGQLRISG